MTKIEERYWIETDSFVHSSTPKKPGIKVLLILMSMLHMHKTHITQVFHALKYFLMLKPFVAKLNLYILLKTLMFLLLTLKDLICTQDNQILVL